MRLLLKRSYKKPINESIEWNLESILQKSQSHPVYIFAGTDPIDIEAVKYAAQMGGGTDYAMWFDPATAIKTYHSTGEAPAELKILQKLQNYQRFVLADPTIFIIWHRKLAFELPIKGGHSDWNMPPTVSPGFEDSDPDAKDYTAADYYHYLKPDGFENSRWGSTKAVIQRKGIVLDAMATSPLGKKLPYGQVLKLIRQIPVPANDSEENNMAPDNMISEHLKRAEQARRQGNYIKESIHKKLANELLNERNDADIYGVDTNEKVILSKWFSARIGKGVDSTRFLQWFVEFMKNPDFVKQWDTEYGSSNQPLAKFFKEAKEYFEIKS